MKLWGLFAVASVALAGCANPIRMAGLDSMGGQITYGNSAYGHESVEGVKFAYPAQDKSGDALPVCVAKTVENNAVTLEGSASSAAIGSAFYSWNKERETGGGQVISYVSEDKKSVIANGIITLGSKGALINSQVFVRYVLSMKSTPEGLVAEFGKLQRASGSTGSLKNDGFGAIGSWKEMHPDRIVKSLKSVSDNINECIAGL